MSWFRRRQERLKPQVHIPDDYKKINIRPSSPVLLTRGDAVHIRFYDPVTGDDAGAIRIIGTGGGFFEVYVRPSMMAIAAKETPPER